MEDLRRLKDPMLRLVGINVCAGIVLAALAAGGVLALDPQMRRLVFADHTPLVPLLLLGGGFIITFASVLLGTAIMTLDGSPRARR